MRALAGLMGLKLPPLRRRVALLLGSLVAVGLFSTVAVGFLCLGLYLSLATRLPPVYAALLVALIGLLLAALSVSVLVLAARRTQRAVTRTVEASALAALAPSLVALAARHTRVLAAVAVGALAFMAMRRR